MKQCILVILGLLLTSPPALAQADVSQVDSTRVESYYAGGRRPVAAAAEVAMINVGIWAWGHYKLDGYWTQIDYNAWETNLRHGFEWDPNAFFNNFFSHPYHGSLYFNAARTSGMNFWESVPYTFGGSAMWELFMESEFPAFNDWIMTSMGGIALGEALFRFSSQTLDNSATGFNRVWREALAFGLNPMGGFNRLVTGEMFRTRSSVGHIRRPLSGFVAIGGRGHTTNVEPDSISQSAVLQFGLAYGDVFADEARKPFDFFTFRLWTSRGKDIRNLIIWQRAMLAGKTRIKENGQAHTWGLFQYYDMMNLEIIKIGSMSLGGGLYSNFPFGSGRSLTLNPHLGAIVLGASNTEYVDPNEERDYNYGWGFQGKLASNLELRQFGNLLLSYNYFGIYTLDGAAGVERLHVLNAMYTLPIWKGFGLSGEYSYYHRNAEYNDFPDVKRDLSSYRLLLNYTINPFTNR